MDLPRGIESDDDSFASSCSSEDEQSNVTGEGVDKKNYFNADFEFVDITQQQQQSDPWKDIGQYLKKKRLQATDDNIVKVLRDSATATAGGGGPSGEPKSADNGAEEAEPGLSEDNDFIDDTQHDELRVNADELRRKKKKEQRVSERQRQEECESGQFFTEITGENVKAVKTFHEMNLSRPLLRALGEMQLLHPTPIQKCTVPVALLGRDICACAATGTGKTAAFLLPTLERLVCSGGVASAGNGGVASGSIGGVASGGGGVASGTRVLILVPTRELGAQVFMVARQLSQYIGGLQVALVAGGMDIKVQEAQLRRHPDLVIATPGRLIDHLQNTHGFCLDTVEVLILDEADRMLDEYFAEQMTEIIRQCAPARQTMLFSATMNDDVKDLAAASLKDPVKIFVNENTDVAARLKQEFVRIRDGHQGDREAILAALLLRTFKERVMVFVRTKVHTHRLHILLGLLGIKVCELHGGLTQAQRLNSLRCFKENKFDVLLATDVAARGLDIPDVKTVVNLTMPATMKQYVHRVGRTARAGRSGRSLSLVSADERTMLRHIGRRSLLPLQARVVPAAVVDRLRQRIAQLAPQVNAVLRLEREQREMRMAESQLSRAERQLRGGGAAAAAAAEPAGAAASDQSGPSPPSHLRLPEPQQRTWFQTQTHKKRRHQRHNNGGVSQTNRPNLNDNSAHVSAKKTANVGNITKQQRERQQLLKQQQLHAKAHKRAQRAGSAVDNAGGKKRRPKSTGRGRLNLTSELTDTSRKAVKGFRHRAAESIREKKFLKNEMAKSNAKNKKRQR